MKSYANRCCGCTIGDCLRKFAKVSNGKLYRHRVSAVGAGDCGAEVVVAGADLDCCGAANPLLAKAGPLPLIGETLRRASVLAGFIRKCKYGPSIQHDVATHDSAY
jgi:hypothetical protein